MKVVVYTAETEVPFDEFYKPFGSWKKIIFSNKKQFDERAVKSILDVTDFKDENTVFYVPLKIEKSFTKSLKHLSQISEWKKETLTKKHPKDALELHSIDNELSTFFDNMVLEWIMEPKIDEIFTANNIANKNLPIHQEESNKSLSLSQIPQEEKTFLLKIFIVAFVLASILIFVSIGISKWLFFQPHIPTSIEVKLPDEFNQTYRKLQEELENINVQLQRYSLSSQKTEQYSKLRTEIQLLKEEVETNKTKQVDKLRNEIQQLKEKIKTIETKPVSPIFLESLSQPTKSGNYIVVIGTYSKNKKNLAQEYIAEINHNDLKYSKFKANMYQLKDGDWLVYIGSYSYSVAKELEKEVKKKIAHDAYIKEK